MSLVLRAIPADITTLAVDAIVNAANESLAPGAGVCGAIFRAAGPGLIEECRRLGSCRTGDARLTKGYRLPARSILHTVGPIWHGGRDGEPEQLASCYRRCLELAMEHDISTVAFPCISTGIYGFPIEKAAKIAITTVRQCARGARGISEVIFCCFSENDVQVYIRLLQEPQGSH